MNPRYEFQIHNCQKKNIFIFSYATVLLPDDEKALG